MTEFAFQFGTRVIEGEGVAARLGERCPKGPVQLVTDRQLLALGLVDAAIERLRADGHDVVLCDAVEADPSRTTLGAAVARGCAAGVSSVIGFGSGSPMDVTKLAAYLIGTGENQDSIWEMDPATGSRLPHMRGDAHRLYEAAR